MGKGRLMSRQRASISASLRARRALLLAEGRRRFYVYPLDVGPHSSLGSVPHDSPHDCIAAAHAWLQRVRSEESWWFTIVERSELPGESVHASVQDILVYNDLLPIRPVPSRAEERGGAHSVSRPKGERNRGQADASPLSGTFKATSGDGVPCRRKQVPLERICHG